MNLNKNPNCHVMTGKSIILFIILFSGIFSHHLLAQNDDKTVQTIIHLLDYTARDYPAAIQNGKIINQNEYTEMMEFSLKACLLYTSPSPRDGLLSRMP